MKEKKPASSTLRLEEWLTLLALVATVLLCKIAGKPFDFSPDRYYTFFFPAIALFLLLGPASAFLRARRRASDGKAGSTGAVHPLTLATTFVRDFWTLPLCFAVYSNLKVLMPLFARRIYDGPLLDLELALFQPLLGQGMYPTRWMLENAGPFSTWLMDKAYLSYFYFYPVSFALLYFSGKRREFRRLLGSVVLVYYAGACLYLLVPVMGPVYFVDRCPEVHRLVLQRSSQLEGGAVVPRLQHYLLVNYMALRRDPGGFVTRPFLGIAAFPSLHVAHGLLFVLSARTYSRLLFLAYLPVFVLLCLSTVFWGWHWLADLLAGAVIALLAFRLFGLVVGRDRDGDRAG